MCDFFWARISLSVLGGISVYATQTLKDPDDIEAEAGIYKSLEAMRLSVGRAARARGAVLCNKQNAASRSLPICLSRRFASLEPYGGSL